MLLPVFRSPHSHRPLLRVVLLKEPRQAEPSERRNSDVTVLISPSACSIFERKKAKAETHKDYVSNGCSKWCPCCAEVPSLASRYCFLGVEERFWAL